MDPATGRPTGHGRVLSRFGIHPRWGHATMRGAQLGCAELAAVVASMLGSERDVLRRSVGAGAGTERSADIEIRLQVLAREGVYVGGRRDGGNGFRVRVCVFGV